MDSETPALQNGASAYFKQIHYKTTFLHNGYMNNLEFYDNYVTVFCLETKKLFDNIIITQNHTVRKMDLILRPIERRPQMQFSIACRFKLKLLRRYSVKFSKMRNFTLGKP